MNSVDSETQFYFPVRARLMPMKCTDTHLQIRRHTDWFIYKALGLPFHQQFSHITIREAPVFDVPQGNQMIKLEVAAYGMEQSG